MQVKSNLYFIFVCGVYSSALFAGTVCNYNDRELLDGQAVLSSRGFQACNDGVMKNVTGGGNTPTPTPSPSSGSSNTASSNNQRIAASTTKGSYVITKAPGSRGPSSKCSTANLYTGGCSCPSGYKSKEVSSKTTSGRYGKGWIKGYSCESY